MSAKNKDLMVLETHMPSGRTSGKVCTPAGLEVRTIIDVSSIFCYRQQNKCGHQYFSNLEELKLTFTHSLVPISVSWWELRKSSIGHKISWITKSCKNTVSKSNMKSNLPVNRWVSGSGPAISLKMMLKSVYWSILGTNMLNRRISRACRSSKQTILWAWGAWLQQPWLYWGIYIVSLVSLYQLY